MALKRKRSSAAFSSPYSDSSDTTTASSSPLPFFFSHSKPVDPLFSKPVWPTFRNSDRDENPHLNSRTRKRHRDNRPDDEIIHANTIGKLFQAQREHPDASPVASRETIQPPRQQRNTLHSFWRIEQVPAAQPMLLDSDHQHTNQRLQCEDCDRPLQCYDTMEINEMDFESRSSCQLCNRNVCDTCAVLGDARMCLGCASHGHR